MVTLSAFGAFVEVGPGREGLVHNTELDIEKVAEPSTVVAVGDLIDVMVLDCANGKLSLSRKNVLLTDAGMEVELKSTGGRGGGRGSGPLGGRGGAGGRGAGGRGSGAPTRRP